MILETFNSSPRINKKVKIMDQEEIDKLKERNEVLFQILKDREEKKKWIDELEVAIEKDYVDKFWIGCKQ